MKFFIKKVLKIIILGTLRLLFFGKIGAFIQNETTKYIVNKTLLVSHNDCSLRLSIPNGICNFRAITFANKEPETLDWIDSMPNDSVLWDVGANVGLYSIYAAKKRNCTVFSFEPSVFNLEFLARNIFTNNLVSNIFIVPLALSDKLDISNFNMGTTDWGGALSTFDKNYGYDGKDMETVFKYNTIGLSMSDAVEKLKISKPDFIKIDVDGIEHLILSGGEEILSNIKGILIEVNDNFEAQRDVVSDLLTKSGLTLNDKIHSEMVESSNEFNSIFNQIWSRG